MKNNSRNHYGQVPAWVVSWQESGTFNKCNRQVYRLLSASNGRNFVRTYLD